MKRKRSLYMVFIWYLLRFCLMTVALVVLVLGLYITLANAGLIRIPTYEGGAKRCGRASARYLPLRNL